MLLILIYLAFIIWVDPYLGYEVTRTSPWSYAHDALAICALGVLWESARE